MADSPVVEPAGGIRDEEKGNNKRREVRWRGNTGGQKRR